MANSPFATPAKNAVILMLYETTTPSKSFGFPVSANEVDARLHSSALAVKAWSMARPWKQLKDFYHLQAKNRPNFGCVESGWLSCWNGVDPFVGIGLTGIGVAFVGIGLTLLELGWLCWNRVDFVGIGLTKNLNWFFFKSTQFQQKRVIFVGIGLTQA